MYRLKEVSAFAALMLTLCIFLVMLMACGLSVGHVIILVETEIFQQLSEGLSRLHTQPTHIDVALTFTLASPRS